MAARNEERAEIEAALAARQGRRSNGEAMPAEEPAQRQLDLGAALGLPPVPATILPRLERSKGVGRPQGARNKRTLARAEELIGRLGDPVEELLMMGMMRVDEIAARLEIAPLEAWQEKRNCLVGVLPYLAQRMPQAVVLPQLSGLVVGGMAAAIFGNAGAVGNGDEPGSGNRVIDLPAEKEQQQ